MSGIPKLFNNAFASDIYIQLNRSLGDRSDISFRHGLPIALPPLEIKHCRTISLGSCFRFSSGYPPPVGIESVILGKIKKDESTFGRGHFKGLWGACYF